MILQCQCGSAVRHRFGWFSDAVYYSRKKPIWATSFIIHIRWRNEREKNTSLLFHFFFISFHFIEQQKCVCFFLSSSILVAVLNTFYNRISWYKCFSHLEKKIVIFLAHVDCLYPFFFFFFFISRPFFNLVFTECSDSNHLSHTHFSSASSSFSTLYQQIQSPFACRNIQTTDSLEINLGISLWIETM